jgi:hypothetical protein
MNHVLRAIISDFQAKVKEANELLILHLEIEEPHNWGPPIEQIGLLGGKHKYFFHGAGCKVQLSKNDVIDFDWGVNGRIDGFDEWRLREFVRARLMQYPTASEGNIKIWLQEAVKANEIALCKSTEYSDLYYVL